jgi:hypothetical protein
MIKKIKRRGYVWVGKGLQGRLKLAGVRPTIKEAIKVADRLERTKVLPTINYIRIHVSDETGVRYQSAILYLKKNL